MIRSTILRLGDISDQLKAVQESAKFDPTSSLSVILDRELDLVASSSSRKPVRVGKYYTLAKPLGEIYQAEEALRAANRAAGRPTSGVRQEYLTDEMQQTRTTAEDWITTDVGDRVRVPLFEWRVPLDTPPSAACVVGAQWMATCLGLCPCKDVDEIKIAIGYATDKDSAEEESSKRIFIGVVFRENVDTYAAR